MAFKITSRQTTFWDMRGEGKNVRIHFNDKEEFGFVEPCFPAFSIVEEHSLLVDYEYSWESIYLAGAVAACDQVFSLIVEAIEGRLEGWRPAARYLNRFGAQHILRGGYGLLVDAPLPVAESCRIVLRNVEARFTSLPSRPSRWPRKAFIAGRNYVVAKLFRIEEVTQP